MPEDAWVIAMELFSPCYISGWTAAEHWELTEQVFNSTFVFSGKKQNKKKHFIAGLIYQTKFIPEKNIFGTKKLWSNNTNILIADIHRTIIDILNDPGVGGGGRHTIDIFNAYSDTPKQPIKLRCYSANGILVGKIRATYERQGRVRDIYDVVNIKRNFKEHIDIAIACVTQL